ncbi:hypothetical protein L198_03136 [Cryptococcus wingfieldii CBS 7118]|uniref:PLC-like phosphodiesterase n=1 Tax=Cryptococcus wingfieldii CBS 7118 TaxID=1295528 RepID=A0A1E3JIT0_9TREE|nr:hypothetical protein L198_03136 [Cryptococcus wingfieldii CBS 7118]ODO00809.1 hypothetical protein L198_03136 [Cryptococcus wingfieldii CBS 7118]
MPSLPSLLALPLLAALPAIVTAADTCNGHSELCSQLYSNVTFIGAHDSYAVGSSVASNQDKDVTSQLNDGIRTLQVQAHNATDGIHLCHSSCSLLDGGLLSDYLSSVASWVTDNPNDVITIVIVNSDNLAPAAFESAYSTAGLTDKAYTPDSQPSSLSDWPSLSDIIDSGKTVVTFMDYEADVSSVGYILDEFTAMWEDAYDVTDASFGCSVNRTSGDSGSQLYMINHFLDSTYSFAGTQFYVPDQSSLNTTNSETGDGSIGYHVDNCNQIWGRKPNHILLDFYNSNENAPFNVAASLNGVSAPTSTVAAGSVAASAATASSTSTDAAVSSQSISGAEMKMRHGTLSGLVAVAGLVMGMGMVLI